MQIYLEKNLLKLLKIHQKFKFWKEDLEVGKKMEEQQQNCKGLKKEKKRKNRKEK